MIIKGKVGKGRGIGKTIGYPTANIDCNPDLENGVFYSLVRLKKNWLPAILIKGVIPKGAEIYLPDWSGDLYGKKIEVKILEKIRDIINFDRKEDLIKKIEEDIKKAREHFNV
jgi:riboflavin kinase/FMN adenylyltransferase